MKPRERILTTLRGEKVDRVPWMEMYIDPKAASDALGRPSEFAGRFSIDPNLLGITALDNISVNFKPPDVTTKHDSGGVEFAGTGLVTGWAQLDLLRAELPDPRDPDFYRPYEEYLERYKDDYAAVVCVRAGIANAFLSMGVENFSLSLYDDRRLVETVLDTFNEWTLAVIEKVNTMGFDLAVVPDDLCDQRGPIFSPQVFRELFAPRYRRVHEALKMPWLVHTDGNFVPLLDDLIALGMVGIGNCEPNAVDIVALKQQYGDRITLFGNVDLHYTLTRGSEADVDAAVKELMTAVAPGGRYMIASENCFPAYSKPGSLLAMSRAVEKYGYYS